jgi:NAD(P)-dependent dehydrogenase (short-subunit alcohol dehydrogenase family)
MFAEVKKLTPRLDILVNNAGNSGVEGRTDLGDIVALRLKQAEEAARGGPVETFLDVTVATSDASWRRMLGTLA